MLPSHASPCPRHRLHPPDTVQPPARMASQSLAHQDVHNVRAFALYGSTSNFPPPPAALRTPGTISVQHTLDTFPPPQRLAPAIPAHIAPRFMRTPGRTSPPVPGHSLQRQGSSLKQRRRTTSLSHSRGPSLVPFPAPSCAAGHAAVEHLLRGHHHVQVPAPTDLRPRAVQVVPAVLFAHVG